MRGWNSKNNPNQAVSAPYQVDSTTRLHSCSYSWHFRRAMSTIHVFEQIAVQANTARLARALRGATPFYRLLNRPSKQWIEHVQTFTSIEGRVDGYHTNAMVGCDWFAPKLQEERCYNFKTLLYMPRQDWRSERERRLIPFPGAGLHELITSSWLSWARIIQSVKIKLWARPSIAISPATESSCWFHDVNPLGRNVDQHFVWGFAVRGDHT
jgi:hypothetical protein